MLERVGSSGVPSAPWSWSADVCLLSSRPTPRVDFASPVYNARDLALVLSWGSHCPPGNRLPR